MTRLTVKSEKLDMLQTFFSGPAAKGAEQEHAAPSCERAQTRSMFPRDDALDASRYGQIIAALELERVFPVNVVPFSVAAERAPDWKDGPIKPPRWSRLEIFLES